jgi:ABC-type amino acid transport substrate-binding protein
MDVVADVRRSRALLIGVGGYRTLPDLPAVPRGVDALHVALRDPDLWGLPHDHCIALKEPRSTSEVLDTVRDMAAGATDTFVLYFAGHGFIEPHTDELYLALPDTDTDRPWTALPYDWLRRSLQRPEVRARRKVVILDCCYSGLALGGALSARGAVADRVTVEGVCVLTASAETKTALAPRGEPFTAFTGEVVSTLTHGIPGGPEVLDVETVYRRVHAALAAKGRPLPQLRSRNTGSRIALVRNNAAPVPEPAPTPVRRRPPALVAAGVALSLLTSADTYPLLPEPVSLTAATACAGDLTWSSPFRTRPVPPREVLAPMATRDHLVIGTTFGRPGHAERCADGHLRGFDVAIGEIIATDLGFSPDQVKWVDVPAAERVTTVREHRVDLLLGMGITPERKQSIAFAGPYEVSSQGLMVRGQDISIAGPESLRNPDKTVCTLRGSTSVLNIQRYLSDPAQLVQDESTIAHCVTLLLQGRVSAVTTDRSVLLGFLPQLGTSVKIVGHGFADSSYGVAVALDNGKLRELVNDSIERSYRDGRYLQAWRNSVGGALPEVSAGPPVDRY